MTRASAVVALCLAGAFLQGCGNGPMALADWRMVDRTRDDLTDVRGGDDLPEPDGVVDRYDNAQGPLDPGVNGNISTKFPADGLYEVVLDACGSQDARQFTWSIDGAAGEPTMECETTVRLAEGPHEVTVAVTDDSGGEDRATMSVEVRDLIVVGLGDSFSAGSGNSRQGLVSLDYDNVRCTRSGRSGQAAAALALEESDPKTSVTFIHLSCGGARTDPGLLRARSNQLPQILELSEILPPDQAVDLVSFTIGGNDIGFSTVIGQLVGEPDAPLSLVEGEQLHAREQRLLLELRQKMTRVAACFTPGIEGQPCVVQGPSGHEDDLQTVALPPIPVVSPERILHVTYPDLTTRFVRDESGELVLDEDGNPQVEVCPSDAVEPPGDLTDGTEDGVSPSPGRAPYISGSEWAWGGATLLWPEDPAPNDDPVAVYPYTPETPGEPDVPLPLVNTLNSIVMESRARFRWSASERWWTDSRGHGYCTPPEENWYHRIIFHPNDAGYAGKAEGLVAEMERLGLIGAQ